MSIADVPLRKRTRLLFRLALSAASLLVALVLAEGGVRLWDRITGTPYSVWRTENAVREIVSAMTSAVPSTGEGAGQKALDEAAAEQQPGARKGKGGNLKYRLHPYTGFTLDARLRVAEQTVALFEEDDPDRPYVIFLQGGSVAATFGGLDQGGSSRLVERMLGDPALEGREIEVIRLAIPGFKQPQQFLQLAYLLSRGCEPDLVLNLDGLNEVRTSYNNARRGLQPTWPSLGHWTQATLSTPHDDVVLDLLVEMRALQNKVSKDARKALDRHYTYSAILGKWTIARLTRARVRWARAQHAFIDRQVELDRENALHPFGIQAHTEDCVPEAVRCWFESSLSMHQLCEARGIRYVHALQPTLHDVGSKPISDEERSKGLPDGIFHEAVVEGYPLLREGIVELRDLGVEALDLSLAFVDMKETLYYDNCHFGTLGCSALANAIADAMGIKAPDDR